MLVARVATQRLSFMMCLVSVAFLSVLSVYPLDIKEETEEGYKETCYSQMHVVAISIGEFFLERFEL